MSASLTHTLAAWCATLALVGWAALRVGPPRPSRTRLPIAAAVATLVLLAATSGVPLLEAFELHRRQPLFVKSATLGWLFERKLHASLAAPAFALAAVASSVLERPRAGLASARARRTTTTLVVLAALSAVLATVAATLARQPPRLDGGPRPSSFRAFQHVGQNQRSSMPVAVGSRQRRQPKRELMSVNVPAVLGDVAPQVEHVCWLSASSSSSFHIATPQSSPSRGA